MPTMEIVTQIGCPLQCTLCPQDTFIKAYKDAKKKLSLEDFKIVANKLPKYVRIDFAGFSEPFLNNWCVDMIEYSLINGFDITIYTTLYKLSINESERVITLIKKYSNQVKQVCLHLPDNKNNMVGWKYSSEYETVLRNFLGISTELKSKINFHIDIMTYKNSPFPLHPKISHISIEDPNYNQFHNNWMGHTRAGNLTTTEKNKPFVYDTPHHNFPVACSVTPYYDHNTMLPNGDVLLCCMDFGLKHIIGNILIQRYEDLYLSEEMMRIMKINKTQEFSKCSLCKSCVVAASYKMNNCHQWESIPYHFYKNL